jgi:hypothetical protein
MRLSEGSTSFCCRLRSDADIGITSQKSTGPTLSEYWRLARTPELPADTTAVRPQLTQTGEGRQSNFIRNGKKRNGFMVRGTWETTARGSERDSSSRPPVAQDIFGRRNLKLLAEPPAIKFHQRVVRFIG